MTGPNKRLPLDGFDEDDSISAILEGTASCPGREFFDSFVENLSRVLHTYGAWVTEYIPESRKLRPLAFWMDGKLADVEAYDIAGTPCEVALTENRIFHIPENILELYPENKDLKSFGAVSYLGAPLLDLDNIILGHTGVLDRRPMPGNPRTFALFRIFAARAAAELQRIRVEENVREREEKLSHLVSSAMDAIIELDHDLNVIMLNPAAENLLKCETTEISGTNFVRFLCPDSVHKLKALIRKLDTLPRGRQYSWIPGGLTSRNTDQVEFPAEATITRFEMQRKTFFTLILRDVNERLEAEKKIQILTGETEYLKEEIESHHNFNEITGRNRSLIRVLNDCKRVASTDATVLILGETGTGKELIARSIHASSPRRDKPLIKVNCAAIHPTLIESELFGHEQGAFTGATKKREGRFALADGGTIFLDEIGELTQDLQVKLLRVLQEGEFEPVGSSRTIKTNVRILAATNRNLKTEVENGNFRSDLYYRLNVFPVFLPPLRQRKDDIELLTNYFLRKHSKLMGKELESVSPHALSLLISYNWPGNIRELENVIERAVILADEPEIKVIDLPDIEPGLSQSKNTGPITLENIERSHIIRVLDETGWIIEGRKGATSVLNINPGTLRSRMKKLGIERPV